ncbi:hypothetical protein BKI52_35990 [marine bacterium AO1-C]|nr:hypothetical protein BKI52_35990 [marine bacterium AO1-C]
MPTALDIIRRKRITDFVWRDVRKIDGTALHVWKNRSNRVLPKRTQVLNGNEIPLINFPEYYANTISSIIAYHFVRKEKKRRKHLFDDHKEYPDFQHSVNDNLTNYHSSMDDESGQSRRKRRKRIVVKKKLPTNNNYTESYYKTNTIRHTSP